MAGGSGSVREEYARLVGRKYLFLAAVSLVLLLLAGVAATLGSADLTVPEVYRAILGRFLPSLAPASTLASTIVWEFRLPRVLFAIVAGFGLGVAGAVMQGVLRNPLASPFTLGIASAAAFGASLAIVLGAGFLGGELVIVVNAFIFTMLAAACIYALSHYRGISAESMVLAGIALMYLFSALTSLLQYTGTSEQLQEVVFWMFGSLQRATWPKLAIVTLVVGVVTPYLVIRSWDLNALAQGDQVARSLGVKVSGVRTVHMFLASLLTAAIICFTGVIGFIGLVGPHIARLSIGGDHRFLVPASGLVGAALLLAADSVARTILAPAIIPVGIMTSLLGIPFFLYLFLKRKEEYW